jgi:hypothetical protein
VTAERRDLPMTPYARPVLQQVAAASNRTLIAFLFESGLVAGGTAKPAAGPVFRSHARRDDMGAGRHGRGQISGHRETPVAPVRTAIS